MLLDELALAEPRDIGQDNLETFIQENNTLYAEKPSVAGNLILQLWEIAGIYLGSGMLCNEITYRRKLGYIKEICGEDLQVSRNEVHVMNEMIIAEDNIPFVRKDCNAFIQRIQVIEEFALFN